MLEDNLKAVVKPQYVDQIPRAVKGPVKEVGALLEARAQMDNMEHVMDVLGTYLLPNFPQQTSFADLFLELQQVKNREIGFLSGGELQRFAIGLVCVQQADV